MSKQEFWDQVFIQSAAAILANPALTTMQMSKGHFDALISDARAVADKAFVERRDIAVDPINE